MGDRRIFGRLDKNTLQMELIHSYDSTMSTLFLPNASPDMSAPGDHVSQCYDQPGLWQFNPTPDTDPSFQPRPHTGIGSHSFQSPRPDISEIVACASEQALDKNVFHARVKWAAGQQQIENAKLKDLVASQTKELEELRLQMTAYKDMIGLFAMEYKELKGASADEEPLSVVTATLRPAPNPRNRADYPAVPFWIREEYAQSLRDANKGETNGEAKSMEPAARRGRPPNDSIDQAIDNSKSSAFLHNADGTRISKEALRHLSWRARMLWISLNKRKLAPPTFGGITTPAWDYYSRTLLNDPKLEFLLLCDDTEWKLRLWSTKAYSSWTGAHGVREKKITSVKQEPTRPLAGPSGLVNIDDEDLIHMGPDNEANDPDDIMGKMHNEDVSPDTTHSDNVDSAIVPDNKAQRPFTPRVSAIVDPFAPASALSSPTSGNSSETGTEAHTTNSTKTRLQGQDNTTNTPSASQPIAVMTETPPPAANITPTAPRDTTKSTSTQPKLMITLRPRLTLTAPAHTAGIDAADPLSPADATTSLILSGPGGRKAATLPTQGNLRLERARVGQDGNSKRKNDVKTPAAATLKRQKVSNTPAEPTHANSIRNICMRRWNEKQPGGKGLASDFDAHFKSLTDAEKEPFRQEMLSIRGAASRRKAKTAATKTSEVATVA
ncbi:hypothetical protein EDB87DRAFT_1666329 [Lactarius vividus]|nr:hypothetical protein EDB87DRAFT_1666329 [Lactarius vividus]